MKCRTTFFVNTGLGFTREVPCGKCYPCLVNKRKEWTFRAYQELKAAFSAVFITLTYDDDHLPLADTVPTLFKRDLQLFFKRLRKENDMYQNIIPFDLNNPQKRFKLTYYAVGEYGPRTERPHYHILLFNLHPDLYPAIDKKWPDGHVKIGKVNSNSIQYVTGYVLTKRSFYEQKENEFALISKGFGKEYMKNALHHLKSKDLFVINQKGKKQSLPRYYRDKILSPAYRKLKSLESEKKAFKLKLDEYDEWRKKGLIPEEYERQIAEHNKSQVKKITKNKKL